MGLLILFFEQFKYLRSAIVFFRQMRIEVWAALTFWRVDQKFALSEFLALPLARSEGKTFVG